LLAEQVRGGEGGEKREELELNRTTKGEETCTRRRRKRAEGMN
jgi:hypothetical protein